MKRQKLIKYAGYTFGGLIITLVLTVLLLPTIFSTDAGRQSLLKVYNESINGSVHIQKMSLSWFGGQQLEGFELMDTDGSPIIRANQLVTDQHLLDILLNGLKPADITITKLDGHLVLDSKGVSNLDIALASLDSPFRMVNTAQSTHLDILDVNAKMSRLSKNGNMELVVNGKTTQADISGNIEINISAPASSTDFIEAISGSAIHVNISHFPVAILDQFISIQDPSQRGFLSSLLGLEVTLKADNVKGAEPSAIACSIQSPNIQGAFKGALRADYFQLMEPTEFDWSLTPEFFKHLADNREVPSELKLEKPTRLAITIEELTVPFSLEKDSAVAHETALKGGFDLQRAVLTGYPLVDALVIDGLAGEFSAPKGAEKAEFYIHGTAQQKQQDVKVKIDATIDKPKTFYDFAKNFHDNLHLDIETTGLPTALLDQATGTEELFYDVLGAEINFRLTGDLKNGSGLFSLSMKSNTLDIPNIQLEVDGDIKLVNAVETSYVLSPALANHRIFQSKNLTIRHLTPINLNITALKIPLSQILASEPGDWSKQAKVGIELSVKDPFEIGTRNDQTTLLISNAKATLDGASLAKSFLTLAVDLVPSNPDPRTTLYDLIGNRLQVEIRSHVELINDILHLPDIQADFTSLPSKAEFRGKLEGWNLELTSPATMSVTITPRLVNFFGLNSQGKPSLLEPTVVHFALNPSTIPMNILVGDLYEIAGHLRTEHLAAAINGTNIEVHNLLIPFEIDRSKGGLKVNFSGRTSLTNDLKDGSFKGRLAVRDLTHENVWSLASANYEGQVHLSEFPVDLLSVLTGLDDLSALLGKTINSEFDMVMGADEESGKLEVLLQGDGVDVHADLTISDTITLNDITKAAKIEINLTPEKFSALQKAVKGETTLNLLAPTRLHAEITHLNLPGLYVKNGATPSLNLWNAGLQAKLSVKDISLYDVKHKQKVEFDAVHVSFDTQNIGELLSFSLNAIPKVGEERSGSLEMRGTIRNTFTSEGVFDHELLTFDFTTKAQNLKPYAFCSLFFPYPTMSDKVEALIGAPLNADIQAHITHMQGPILVAINGPNGNIHLKGEITNGTLILAEPLNAEVEATPKLGEHVLKEIAPFFSALKSSEQRIKIQIQPNGFSFPLRNFSIDAISIADASIETGKMQFSNSGQMKTVLGLLRGSDSSGIEVWLTPMYVHLQNGKVKLERVDMLVNQRFPLAAWGSIDLVKEKVNMVIGILGQAIERAFGIDGISPNYVLQLPLKGSLLNPKLDKNKAAARISALLANGQGAQGKVVGTFLDIASGKLSEDRVPPPTTIPPWMQGTAAPQSTKQEKPQSKKKKESRDFEKGAKSLIRNFIK